MKYSEITERNKRRYYLHKRLVRNCQSIKASKKTILIYPKSIDALTKGQKRNMSELIIAFGYSVQQTIPDQDE